MLELNMRKDGVTAEERRKRISAALAGMSPIQRRRAERFAASLASHPGTLEEDPMGVAEDAIEFTLEIWDYPGSHADEDPATDWCSAELDKGGRCTMDAVKDGLCKRHWRAKNSGWAGPATV